MRSVISFFALVVIVMPAVGCTHRALRRNTVNVAGGINQIHQQQVLNNLAMFVADPYALPHFSLPGSGTSQVNDVASLDTPIGLGRLGGGLLFGLASFDFSPSLSRTSQESWGLAPVNDPRQLELMRCAYQRAVSQCGVYVESTSCPDCEKLWNKFYTGDPDKAPEDQSPTVTAECLNSGCCWFCIGCKKCAAKSSKCQLVGEWCGTFVWIPPSGRDEFTKLTLTILDIAFKKTPEDAAPPTKEVTFYLNAEQEQVPSKDATQEVKATIPLTTQNEMVLKTAFIAELDELLEAHHLTTDDLGDFSVEGWSSAEIGRLSEITEFLGIGIRYSVKQLKEKAKTAPSSPTQDLNRLRSSIPPRVQVLPRLPAALPAPAGDLLQLQRELNRVTVPQ